MLAHVTINFDYQFGRKIIKDTNERHAIDLPSPFTYKQAKEAAEKVLVEKFIKLHGKARIQVNRVLFN